MQNSKISVPIPTKLFIELSSFLSESGSDRDPVIAVIDAINYWMDNAAWKKEDFEQAEKYSLLANGFDPHKIEPYNILTSIYFRQRKLDAASEITEKFSENFPDSAQPALNQARIYEYQGDYENADAVYLEIVKKIMSLSKEE